jgi:hypothetical protein
MLQRYSVQHYQGTQTRLDNGRYPVNTTRVNAAEHIEISANTRCFTFCVEYQVVSYQNIPHPAHVCEKEVD